MSSSAALTFQYPLYPAFGSSHTVIRPQTIRQTDLKLLVVPGDDVGAAKLAVHTEGAHLRLQGVAQLLPRLQVPDEVGLRVVQLESLNDRGGCRDGELQENMHSDIYGQEATQTCGRKAPS